MAKRNELIHSARMCVNAMRSPKPNNTLFDNDLPLCVIFCTRWKLIRVAHSILDCLERRREIVKDLLHRYFKLTFLHHFQLKKYQQVKGFTFLTNDIKYISKMSNLIASCVKHFN